MNKSVLLVVVFGRNEHLNIHNAIKMHQQSIPVLFIDSGSSDSTIPSLQKNNVPICETTFTTWPNLRNYGLQKSLHAGYKYSLLLDSDEQISYQHYLALCDLTAQGEAFKLHFKFFFNGRLHRFAKHRPRVRLVKNESVAFVGDTIAEYISSTTNVQSIPYNIAHIVNDDHSSYQQMLCKQAVRGSASHKLYFSPNGETGLSYRQILMPFLEKHLLFKAFLLFVFNYILRLGFMDGPSGFYYCFSQSFLFHLARASFEYYSADA